jgi:drug/metabolite transporter (DMT)-like permease
LRDIAAPGASTASTVTSLTPLFAVAVRAALVGEQVCWNQRVEALIVLTGIAHSQGRLPLALRPRSAAVTG